MTQMDALVVIETTVSYAVEVAGSIDLGNGFTVFAGAAFEDADSGDNQLINAYVDLRNWRMVVRC